MELLLSILVLVANILCFLVYGHLARIRDRVRESNNLVPEAAGSWPLIGHLHLLAGSQVPHKVLGSLADKFGPIFTIKLGVHRVLVVSNSEVAKECLTTNDKVFASRPKAMATELMGYNYANFALSHGPYWREIRKIVVLELVSQHRLRMLARVRVSEVKKFIIDMYRTCNTNKGSPGKVKIDMKKWFGDLTVNIVERILFGDCFSSIEQNDQFKKDIRRFNELLGAFIPSDVIPGLRWLDLGGYEKMMKKTAKDIDVVIDGWLEEHKKIDSTQHIDGCKDQVFMATLLCLVKEKIKEDLYGFSIDAIVKATCLAIFSAATDTTTVTLTWALALLVNNPHVLTKAQEELENHVGKDRIVEESDLKNLVYLQAIIKETMRLYPPAPLSVPHESTEDCIISGYTVPKETRLLVNIWKIHHDPQIWTDPFEFQPERFLTSKKEIDVKGQHFELIPFGSGRRICLGISFALDALQLILATVIHGFEFQNPSKDQIDMTESPGLTSIKATPLELLVAPRLLPQKDPALFFIKLHHAGKLKELDKKKYVNDLVAYVDGLDIDKFFVHELNEVMMELGYVNNDDPIYYHYMIPGTDLEICLRALDPEPLPAKANANENEIVESIVQELMSMNYEFDPFVDNMTASLNDQPSVNEHERARDDNNEPEETLVKGETLVEDEEYSSTEEGDSDSEDDEVYFVDEDTYFGC
nr:cytochrome P450 CYP82D47-like [Tanacetum cinerariifolium]